MWILPSKNHLGGQILYKNQVGPKNGVNDIIYSNMDKLKKMQQVLRDYGQAQISYALKIQGKNYNHKNY